MNVYVEYVAIIVTALVSVGGMVTGFLALRGQKKKNLSSASESIAEAAKILIEPLRKRVIHLEEENEELKTKCEGFNKQIQDLRDSLEDFRTGTERLVYQLRALDAVPVWTPEKGELNEPG